MTALRRATSFLAPYWLSTVGAMLSLVMVNLATFAYPQLIRRIIDGGIARHNWTVIVVSTGGLLLLAGVRGGFNFLQAYLSEQSSQDAAYDMRNVIYAKLQSLSFSYHDQTQTTQVLTRMTSDVEIVRRFVGQGLLQLAGALLTVIGSAAILIAMNWRLGLAAVVVMPIIFVLFVLFVRAIEPGSAMVQARLTTLNGILEENLAGYRVVQAFVRQEYERRRYRAANDLLLNENLALVRMTSIRYPLIYFMANLATGLVLWYGGVQVIGGTLTVGQLVAFMSYLNFLLFPMFLIGMLAALLARAIASARRIFEVIDAESEVADQPDAIELPPIAGAIEFKNVSFRYVGSDRLALDRVSCRLEPRTTTAIVGATGSGKSTLAHLIPRFYDPTEGQVLIDGYDVRQVRLASLRRQIGVVLQDTLLFSGTIRDNIAYGRPDASLDEVIQAARIAQAHDFILEQPLGYDTRLGEGGLGLSGGQRQRLALARTLLMDPRILILDDSTSSVDAETEYRIQEAMDRLIEGRTTVIIAQRISSVRRADRILVVDDARLVAQGTHDELLETSPLYGEIVSSQLLHDDAPVPVGRGA